MKRHKLVGLEILNISKSVVEGQHHRRTDPLTSLKVERDLNHD